MTSLCNLSYPLITYTDNGILQEAVEILATNKKQKIFFENITDDDILSVLNNGLQDGGCAGVIFNTVKRAQNFYSLALSHFKDAEISLLHSGFLALDISKVQGFALHIESFQKSRAWRGVAGNMTQMILRRARQ